MKKLKVVSAIFLCFVLLSSTLFVYGANMLKNISVAYRNITIQINGKLVPSEQEPFIYAGRTFVPLRTIGDAFNKKVDWDNAKNQITISDPVPDMLRLDSYTSLLNYFPDNYKLKAFDEKLTTDEILKTEEFLKKVGPNFVLDTKKSVLKSFQVVKNNESITLFFLNAPNNCICLRFNDGRLYYILSQGTFSFCCGSSDGFFRKNTTFSEKTLPDAYFNDYLVNVNFSIMTDKPNRSKQITDLYAIYLWVQYYGLGKSL